MMVTVFTRCRNAGSAEVEIRGIVEALTLSKGHGAHLVQVAAPAQTRAKLVFQPPKIASRVTESRVGAE